jgi:hypothetical protein
LTFLLYLSAAASSESDHGSIELGLENGITALDPTVERRRHPPECRVPKVLLDVGDDLAGIGLIPAPVQVLGREAKLNAIRLPERSSGSISARFSRQSRMRAASSFPIMIRESEPPMK